VLTLITRSRNPANPNKYVNSNNQVKTYAEVASALRHCDHLCTLMTYQSEHMKNSYSMRVALIQHLFTEVIPLPLPFNHPKKASCMWSQSMSYPFQVEILRNIRLISQHFAAASFSLKLTRSFDATRVLTMACMSTVADAVIR
jgi:hypothetical protein